MLKLLYLSRPLERRVIGLFFPSKYKIEYKDMWAICGHGRVDYDTFLLEIFFYLIIQYYSYPYCMICSVIKRTRTGFSLYVHSVLKLWGQPLIITR